MRLTLRTLLAWIDEVLPPAEREELAAKVAESPIAPKLIAKIRQAIEHPPADSRAGESGTDDANAVADYLDNVLATAQLEAFERHCLETEAALGEVAACHQILAAAARHPEQITPLVGEPRRRLIRIVAEALAGEGGAAVAPATESEAAAAAIATALETSAGSAPAAPRGMQAERASVWAWLAAAAAVALLAVLGGLLARSIWPAPRIPARDLADGQGNHQPDQVAAAAPSTDDDPDAAERAIQPDAAPVSPAGTLSVEPAAAREVAETVSAVAPPPPIPLPDMDVSAATPPAVAEAVDSAEPPAQPESAPQPGRVAAGDLLLHRPGAGASGWQPRLPGDPLAVREELLVPSLCYPVLERGDLRIRLLPGTQAILTPDGDGTPRLEILFGKGVVWTEAATGATVGVTAGGLAGLVALGPRQPLGIDVRLTHEPGDDPTEVASGQTASVFATGGTDWRQDASAEPGAEPLLAGIQAAQPMPPRSSLRWTSAAPEQARLERDEREPAWLAHQQPEGRTLHAARAALAECLAAVPTDGSVEDALRGLARDRRAENRMAAASTLALVGDFDELVRLLCEQAGSEMLREGQWTTLVADTIPLALGRGFNAAARLKTAFLSQGPAGRGELLFQLACGLSPADLAAGGAEQLVTALDDPLLVVRRFAAVALQQAAGDGTESLAIYRPDRDASLNQKGVAWWQTRVKPRGNQGPAMPERQALPP